MKNYEIIRKGNYVRWRNWKEFIEKETVFEKNNKILVAFVTYNNFSGAISLLKKCFEESKKFDLLILDNHSDIEQYRELENYCIINKVNLIRTKENLGGGGGYGLILEYFLNSEYEYILLLEDDVIPLQKNTIARIISCVNNKKYDEISIIYDELGSDSYTFHYHLYSKDRIRSIGIVDPSYFMRDDDGEFAIRLSKIPCRKKTIHFLRYSHPVCKGSNSPLSVYFINRNILFTSEYHSKYFFRSLVTNFLYLGLGLLFFIENRKAYYLKSVLLGIFDYIFGRKNFVVNEIRRREFKDKKIKENFPILTTTRKKFKFHEDGFFLNPEIKMYFRKDKTISFKRIIKIGNTSLLNIIAPFFKEKISLNYVQGDKIEYTFEQGRKFKEIKNLFFIIPVVLFISSILMKLILLKAIIKKLFLVLIFR